MNDRDIINRIPPTSPLLPFTERVSGGVWFDFIGKKINHEKTILFAEDNARDRLDITRIFEESQTYAKLRFVEDGSDLLNYLCKRRGYTSENAPLPDLIVFDINISDNDSYEALDKIKEDPVLKQKTIIVLAYRPSFRDIEAAFDLGATISRIKPWRNEENRYIEFFQSILTLS